MAGVHSTPSRTCWIWPLPPLLKTAAPTLRHPGTRLRISKSSSPPPRLNWWQWSGSVSACIGRGRKPDPVLRRRLLGVIWMLTFGGMQWRLAGLLSGIAFTTLHSSFARWTRLGLWRRLGQRLALDWRVAREDEALPSAL